jgi:hypothetical protein
MGIKGDERRINSAGEKAAERDVRLKFPFDGTLEQLLGVLSSQFEAPVLGR